MNFERVPDDFNVMIDPDFDAMAVLHGEQKLAAKPIAKVPEEKDDDEEGDKKPDPRARQTVTLTDEMLEQGFSKARDLSSQTAGGPTGMDKPKPKTPDSSAPAGKQEDTLPPDDKSNVFTTHYKMMVATGAWKEIEGFDGTEEKYLEAAEANEDEKITERMDGYFDEAFEKNPEGKTLGIQLFRHLRAGGRIADFQALYAPAEFRFEDIDDKDDDVAEAASKDLIRNYYSSIGWKKQKIDDRINSLTKTGRLIDEAKDVKEPYQDLVTHQQKIHQQQLERNDAARKEYRTYINNSLQKIIEENKGYGAVKLYDDRKGKEQFSNYFFAADQETGRSAFSDDLNEGLKDPEFLIFLGVALQKKLYKNADQMIDKKAADSKATSRVRETLEAALLNKSIGNSMSASLESEPAPKGKYKFDLDNARVLS